MHVVIKPPPHTHTQGTYYEALCKDIDPVKKELVCCFPADAGLDVACFKISYDVLVMSVSQKASLCCSPSIHG